MYRIEFLPAQQGDAIWIEYGSPGAVHRILIDAGTPATAPHVRQRIDALPSKERTFDLVVVTHVDTDHIGGVLKLLANLPPGVKVDDVWFNAWPQIRNARSSRLGPVDGEILSAAIEKRKWPWNGSFGGAAVMAATSGAPVEKTLRGGMRLTVLSPGEAQLARLRDEWKEVVEDAGLDPKNADRRERLLAAAARKGVKSSILGEPTVETLARSRFTQDTAVANGSTIALLAEFGKKSILLAGDAHPSVLVEAIGGVCRARRLRQLTVDALKVPHHGSCANVSNELLAAVPSSRYVFSTSGAVFGHPDDEAIARVIAARTRGKKTLLFNYPAETIAKNYTKKKQRTPPDWNQPQLRRTHNFSLEFASDDDSGIVVDLEAAV